MRSQLSAKLTHTVAMALLLVSCGVAALPYSTQPQKEAKKCPKLIVVLFGGGTRSSESIDDPTHQWIPHLWNDMMPKGTLFTNMRVEHKVVHTNSAGSVVTGHWEYDDIDWSKPVKHPTMYEVYRKQMHSPDTSTWAFVYASILSEITSSQAKGYGSQFAANVVVPPTIPRTVGDEIAAKMSAAAATGSSELDQKTVAECAKLAKTSGTISIAGLRSKTARDFVEKEYAKWQSNPGTTSHDAYLTDAAISCMKEFAPPLLTIMYGEIDCAHYGSWSRYTDAIKRTDELTWKLWKEVHSNPAYKDNTLMLILPDHGRELESKDGLGFVHHSDFYTNNGSDEGCRRVWMLTIGPGVKQERKVEKAIPITAVAATGLEYLGLKPSTGAAKSVLPLATK